LLAHDPQADKSRRRTLNREARELAAQSREAVVARDSAGNTPVAGARYRAGVAWRRLRRLEIRARLTGLAARAHLRRRVNAVFIRGWRLWDARVARWRFRARWRVLLPDIVDLSLAFSPVIDELEPDVIHAHDVHMVGIAADAVERARHSGRTVPWIYDAHEFVQGLSQYGGRTRRVVAAWADLEREYIGSADRVITVSPAIADKLQECYRLPRRPAVVLNAPVIRSHGTSAARSVRDEAGIAADVPFVVYSGGVTTARGLHTVIEALPRLPGVHFGIVAVPARITRQVEGLLDLAEQRGVADRVHILPPVAAELVVGYLSSATVGVAPLLHFGSHDMALPNKLFEHLHGGTPVVVSDCRVMAAFVRELGVGEVFPAGDPAACADALSKVISNRDSYTRALAVKPSPLAEYTWKQQETVLRRLYRELLSDHPWVTATHRRDQPARTLSAETTP
jgi:glycosyltransferase involved in cell wall biosynthesis